ncbi:MAG: hypothetical protein QOH97_170 [Actinoplanes sp.]|jgi:hypothetical protein|nr:hypothetical protein [Actinoplanes sp.]
MRRAGLLIAGVFLATGAGLVLSSPASAAGTSGASTATASTARHDHPDCDEWSQCYDNNYYYWHHHHRHHHYRWHLWDDGGWGPWSVLG